MRLPRDLSGAELIEPTLAAILSDAAAHRLSRDESMQRLFG